MPEKSTSKARLKNGSTVGETDDGAVKYSLSSAGEDRSQGKPAKPSKPKPKSTAAKSQVKASEVIEELEAKQKELEEKYIRLRAEFDNHIKRTNKEKGDMLQFAGSHAIRAMLPILDDLQRTVEHAEQGQPQDADPVVAGVKMIIDKFQKVLEGEGVEVIRAVGQEFDPELHEALMTRNSDEYPEGIVIEEYEPGYIYRGKVLRHAKVIVCG